MAGLQRIQGKVAIDEAGKLAVTRSYICDKLPISMNNAEHKFDRDYV